MDLSDRYRVVRSATRALAAPLSAEDCAIQSMPDASPTKWHLAHTTWFFETLVLEAAVPGYKAFDPHYRVLFNSYYNSIGEQYDRPSRGLLSRPGLDEVMAYRERVDGDVQALLEDALPPGLAPVVELGLHHEQQHQELVLTDIKHALSRNPMRPTYLAAPPEPPAEAAPLRWLACEAGLREIGCPEEGFAFDNERPRHRHFVDAFEIASRPVTNGEYRAFIEDGGYERPELWLSDGWEAARRGGWRAPLYWERGEDGFGQLTLHGFEPVRAEDPVCHVSHFEADAYARWADARLPTEQEWEAACPDSVEGHFVEDGRLHPRPTPDGPGLRAAFGDVWEWTASPYAPYPRFRPLAGSLGEYNGKFMSGQMVLRGGSCATPRSHIRPTYRNFFPPSARWQLSGIRLARDPA